MNQRFQAALRREPQPTPPVWFMRQAGRYHRHYQALKERHSFMDLCKIPELAAETALGPVRDFDFDTAILFSDLLFPLEALGMGLRYEPSPTLGFTLDSQSIGRLRRFDDACPALEFQGEAVRATRALLPSDKSLIGFVGGPWTLFVYAVEGSHKGSLTLSKQLLASLYPRFVELLLPLLGFSIERQLAAGAELVMLFDTAAGELSPELYSRYVIPALSRLATSRPGLLGYYGKGLSDAGLELMEKLPLAGIGLDHRHSFRSLLPRHRQGFLQGNFDQSLLLLEPGEFEREARVHLDELRALSPEQRRGWVAGLGHGVLPGTPEKNVRRYVELVRELFR